MLYLSMIRDLYGNSIVAYKTIAQQTGNLVLDAIRLAIKKEKKRVAVELQFHSDQDFHYTSHAYFKLTQSYRTTPAMSNKGNPHDNAMAENFFSILKTECSYLHKPKTFAEANYVFKLTGHHSPLSPAKQDTRHIRLQLRQAKFRKGFVFAVS